MVIVQCTLLQVVSNMVYALERPIHPKLKFARPTGGPAGGRGQPLQSSATQPARHDSRGRLAVPQATPGQQAQQGQPKHPAQHWSVSACQMLHQQQATQTCVNVTGHNRQLQQQSGLQQLQAQWRLELQPVIGLQTGQGLMPTPAQQLHQLRQQQQQQQQQ